MFKFLKFFLVFIILYHILITFVVFQLLHGSYHEIISISKDILWILFVLFWMIGYWRKTLEFIKKFYIYILLVIWFIGWWVLISYINNTSIFEIFVWLKYTIYFIIIFILSSYLWFIAYKKNLTKHLLKYYNFLFYLILFAISFWLVRWLAKLGFKDAFLNIGYWPLWDYEYWESPPVYYLTWPDGIPRNSGIFAGPNNFGFFLVVFFSFFFFKLGEYLKEGKEWTIKSILWGIIYIWSGILTLSRGFFVGLIPQIYYFLLRATIKSKTAIWTTIGAIFIGVAIITIYKPWSTIEHFSAQKEGFTWIMENTQWKGLWTSWPWVHYWWEILPENTYFQIIIDTGIIGFFFWIAIIIMIFYFVKNLILTRNNFAISKDEQTLYGYFIWLSIWLFGLILEGFFLHVFEDSMVNYTFFISYWILFGYFFSLYYDWWRYLEEDTEEEDYEGTENQDLWEIERNTTTS